MFYFVQYSCIVSLYYGCWDMKTRHRFKFPPFITVLNVFTLVIRCLWYQRGLGQVTGDLTGVRNLSLATVRCDGAV